jgi:hypothetical protein
MGKMRCGGDLTAIEALGKQLAKAIDAVNNSLVGTPELRKQLIEKMEKRWKGSFASTGKLLSKKRSKDEKSKG